MNKLCSCIVPCFNEEKVIPIYYDEMQKVMKQEENIEFEIILWMMEVKMVHQRL